MELYQATLKACGPFTSELQSDTFFGAFCWSYKYLYGEPALTELLKKCRAGEVPLIFSRAFPAGYLPLPLGIGDPGRDRKTIRTKEERKTAYQQNKKYKKCPYVSKEWFAKIQHGEYTGYSEGLMNNNTIETDRMHNTVSRELGNTTDLLDGGGLYSREEYFSQNGRYDLYILTTLDEDTLITTLETMLTLGIGGKKSTGKGSFTLEAPLKKCNDMMICQGANAYLALSNFIPASTDPTEGYYKTYVKNGKLDREYAATEYPFKKPLLFIESGAVFKTDTIKPYYGHCLTNIAVNPEILVNACTIALPLTLL